MSSDPMNMKKESWLVVFIFFVTVTLVALSGFLESGASKIQLVGALSMIVYGAYCLTAHIKKWQLFAGVIPLDPMPENKVWRFAAVAVGVLFYAIGLKYLYDI